MDVRFELQVQTRASKISGFSLVTFGMAGAVPDITSSGAGLEAERSEARVSYGVLVVVTPENSRADTVAILSVVSSDGAIEFRAPWCWTIWNGMCRIGDYVEGLRVAGLPRPSGWSCV